MNKAKENMSQASFHIVIFCLRFPKQGLLTPVQHSLQLTNGEKGQNDAVGEPPPPPPSALSP